MNIKQLTIENLKVLILLFVDGGFIQYVDEKYYEEYRSLNPTFRRWWFHTRSYSNI